MILHINYYFFSILLIKFLSVQSSHKESHLKCLVCQQVVKGIDFAITNEDPKKTVQIGSFRIQPDGTQKQTQIKYAGSEFHINEVLENICDSMDDYAEAKNKETGMLTLLNLSKDVGKLSTHELVKSPDLNRSLKFYCESFIEDHEDDIIFMFKESKVTSSDTINKKLCVDAAGYCSLQHVEL